MKYWIALVVGYYILEAGRHFVRQFSKWSVEDSSLPFTMQAVLVMVILGTCLCWPVMYIVGKRA